MTHLHAVDWSTLPGGSDRGHRFRRVVASLVADALERRGRRAERYDGDMDFADAIHLLRARVPDIRVVWLYGSQARADARTDSDVDLALLADAPVRRDDLLSLQSDLAALVGAEVDLVDLLEADDVLRMQVIEHGRMLYERTPSDRARFEMQAASRYAHLNEERQEILEDVIRRGSVYG